MKFELPLQKGTLLQRYKRFLCDVELFSGEKVTAHCPNPGRMQGCSEPGSEVVISTSPNPKRKLKHTLELVKTATSWVGVNPLRANAIVEEALIEGRIDGLEDFEALHREIAYGQNSRIDLVLQKEGTKHFIEVKSVTLAENGTAMFPDAPTARGRKHLHELMHIVASGNRAAMFFLVQREDTNAFCPASHIDPHYATRLKQAVESGVDIFVYDCTVTENGIRIRNKLNWEIA